MNEDSMELKSYRVKGVWTNKEMPERRLWKWRRHQIA